MTDLDQLSAAATPGEWVAGGGSLGESFVFVKTKLGFGMNFTATCDKVDNYVESAFNAAFIAVLVNEHRAGNLIPLAAHETAIEAAVLAERERCAVSIQNLRNALTPFAFFDEDNPRATTQDAWEIRYNDLFKYWVDFNDIEAARAAIRTPEATP